MAHLAIHPAAYSVSFDGASDWVTMGNNFDKERTDSFSVSAWICWRSSGGVQAIVGKNFHASPFNGWVFQVSSTGQLACLFGGAGGAGHRIIMDSGASVLTQNVWTHVVMTYAGTSLASGIKFYKNASLLSTTVTENDLDQSISTTYSFTIGAENAANTAPFVGEITDVRLHNAELSQTEVTNLYLANIATHVQAYWPFTDGIGSTVTASVGGVNGTISGAVWSTSAPKNFSAGRLHVLGLNNSLNFDKSNSHYVALPNDIYNSRLQGAVEVRFWIDETAIPGTDFPAMFGAGNSDANNGWFFQLSNTGSVFKLRAGFKNTNYCKGAITLPQGRWIHGILASDHTTWTMFINGVQDTLTVESGSNNGAWFGDLSQSTTMKYFIGMSWFTGSASRPFLGKIAYVRIFATAPTAAQALTAYQTGQLWDTVLDEWRFSDGSGSTLTNAVNPTNNGTIQAGVTWNTTGGPSPSRSSASARTAASARSAA